MGIQSVQTLAFAGLVTAAIAFAAQTTPLTQADVCVAPMIATSGSIELAAMFTSDDRAQASLFSDAPLFIYAMNEVARESDGVDLIDVSDVTSCARHKNSI